MTNTSTHPISIDGIRLDTYARNVEIRDGLNIMPAAIGENVQFAGRSGRMWTPYKLFDEATYALSLWVSSKHPDGGGKIGYDDRQALEDNLDYLKVLLGVRRRLMDVRVAYGAPIGTRQAFCEVTAMVVPKFFGWGTIYNKLSVALINPYAFWQDVDPAPDFVWTNPSGAIKDVVLDMTTFDGATAPMEDLQFRVTGPCNNPEIRDYPTGHYVRLNQTLAAGQQWLLNNGTMASRVGSATLAFDGVGGANAIADTQRSGPHMPQYMTISPRQLGPADPPLVRFICTGGATTATKLEIHGRRKFL